MNGAENGTGVSGNADAGVQRNAGMEPRSDNADGYEAQRGVGVVGELLNSSEYMGADYLDSVHSAGRRPKQRKGSCEYQN